MTGKPLLKVGLIGFGAAGRTFHAPLITATQGLELSAIASSRAGEIAEAYPQAKAFSDPQAMIESGIDLAVVATPNDSHAFWSMAALSQGVNVVVDKPFALDLSQARAMSDAAKASGKMLCAFQNRRWDSDFLTLRAAISEGVIGEVRHFESHIDRYRPAVRDRWREQAGPGAGLWYDLGPHLVDQALQLFGLPDSVDADIATLREGGQSDDWAHCVLHYPGLRVVLHASMLAAGGFMRFLVHGQGGSLVKAKPDQQEAQLLAGIKPGALGWGDDADPLVIFDGAGERFRPALCGDQREFYSAVRDAIATGGPVPAPPAQALAVTAVIEAAQESSRTGRRTQPALTTEERKAFQA